MKKVTDYIEYYYKEKGLNCAETILSAANDAWQLQLSDDAKKLMGGFGGGMGKAIVCGAVSGGVAALSHKMVKETGHKSPELMTTVRKFIDAVRKECGSENCKDIHGKYATKEEKCLPTIRLIGEILDQVYSELCSENKELSKKQIVCAKVSMPETLCKYVDYLYTSLDQEVVTDSDDEGFVVKKYRRSWLEHLYKRGVLNKIEVDGEIRYRVAHVAVRLESFIVLEKAYWISLPEYVRKEITDKYIMNPELWNEPRLNHPEMGDTVLPLEEALKILQASDTEYYFLA